MMGKIRLLLLGVLLLVNCGNALDLVVTSISCDSTLPVSVSRNYVALTCDGKKQCTFGELATLQGQLQYQQVQYLDLEEDYIVYMTAYFDVSVDFLGISDGTALSLCSKSIEPVSYGTTCPSDGRYNFNVTFYLPYYSDSWWATGWHDSGHINLYADIEEEILIGSCELFYTTKVTSSSHFLHAPSAASTMTLVVSIVGIFLLLSLYHSARDFYCVWKEDHLELHCGRKCCPTDKCFCGRDNSDNEDDDDVYYMEYDEHGEPVKPVYQLSDLPRVDDAYGDKICHSDDDGEADDEESGSDNCLEDSDLYHLEEDAGEVPLEPKMEEKLPPNIKSGGENCVEDSDVYHLQEDLFFVPPEPKMEEKLPPNLKGGGDNFVEDSDVYHLEKDAGEVPPEPKKEEKLPPNIKTPKDLLNEPKKCNPKAKTTVFKVWYIPPVAPCQNVCGEVDDVL
jgi:hypothetical protein